MLRSVAADEREILNLAVSPEFRRRGIAAALWKACLEDFQGTVFLEVRESNDGRNSSINGIVFKRLAGVQDITKHPPKRLLS